jgi:hypothetical protein
MQCFIQVFSSERAKKFSGGAKSYFREGKCIISSAKTVIHGRGKSIFGREEGQMPRALSLDKTLDFCSDDY